MNSIVNMDISIPRKLLRHDSTQYYENISRCYDLDDFLMSPNRGKGGWSSDSSANELSPFELGEEIGHRAAFSRSGRTLSKSSADKTTLQTDCGGTFLSPLTAPPRAPPQSHSKVLMLLLIQPVEKGQRHSA